MASILSSDTNEHAALLAGFAVAPRLDCPHVPTTVPTLPSSFDFSTPCDTCGDTSENCYVQGHMAIHATSQEKAPEHEHAVCVSLSDFSFWCFRCDDYIEDESLKPIRTALHLLKFNEAPGEQVVILDEQTNKQ
ncbi:hypothetical protein BDF22DRAFT_746233 [Syncephalis plumigaleata]|nr:hypothetical protein BDF22DRAFT_746233 [Syncephalis plumigaleata]